MLTSLSESLRLALTTLTIAPIPGPRDLRKARWAMAFAPLIGALLGLVMALATWGLHGLVKGAVMAALGAVLTRGLHLDGLADTIDALGSYKSREKALAIMRSPEVGPFGVAAIALVLLIQAATFATLALPAVALAFAVGRLAATIACQKGVPAARPDGLGAMVAGTVALPIIIGYVLAVVAAGFWIHPWQGPLAVVVSLSIVVLLRHHVVRRLGGITGDVLGFLVEITTTITLVGLSHTP